MQFFHERLFPSEIKLILPFFTGTLFSDYLVELSPRLKSVELVASNFIFADMYLFESN